MTAAAATQRQPNPKRAFLAPEVVQTSAMDCGPAALKSLLEGFGVHVSYGRLREACQTSIDGTSINTIEAVANQLGVHAEQMMLPPDHLFLDDNPILPALMVISQPAGPTHFVVVWRRFGQWLQIMDPGKGRRLVRIKDFHDDVFRHSVSVSAQDWRDWAASDDFIEPLRERMAKLGLEKATADKLVSTALMDGRWFRLAALDASIRLVTMVAASGGVDYGRDVQQLLVGLYHRTCTHPDDIYTIIPPDCWSVSPDAEGTLNGQQHLLMGGAVLLRITGRLDARPIDPAHTDPAETDPGEPALSAELAAALDEKPVSALASLARHLLDDGLAAPAALFAAVFLAGIVTLVEAMLYRGIFEIGTLLNLGSQRIVAVLAMLGFMSLAMALQFPIIGETLRMGRRLEAGLRMALLEKLPRLADRYFQSRPISDMAERGHSIQLLRMVPSMGMHFIQLILEMTMILCGIALIDMTSAGYALLLAILAIGIPFAFQPLVNEGDLRIRSHTGAIGSFYLDALLGIVPIRVHRAEANVRRLHEGLLVEWTRASLRQSVLVLFVNGFQQLVAVGMVIWLILDHFIRANGIGASDLLLLYWALKLPAMGQMTANLAHQYPSQRNILLRLMEPLSAPEEPVGQMPAAIAKTESRKALSFKIINGDLVAGGHAILNGINISVAAGEHIAIVGPSGAGKSSLFSLLLGWHKLAQGTIEVDGQTFDHPALLALRRDTAWVDPSIQLWNQSFLDNLTFSAGADDFSRLGEAIDVADLRKVLEKLEDGLQSSLGESGGFVSGGEGQRVRLARALIQSTPRLVLLDEPFRGMDRQQRSDLLAKSRKLWAASTLLCVTHDVSETLDFNRVIVIDDGGVAQDGAPSELAMQPGRYRDLLDAEHQLRRDIWKSNEWRHLSFSGGLVHES